MIQKMPIIGLAWLTMITITGCLVKPPPDNSSLGASTSADAINAAMAQAQSGVDPVNGFRLGDQGTVLTVDAVMGSQQVSQTAYYQIIAVTSTTYTVQETIGTQIGQGTFYRPGMAPSPSPSPSPTPSPTGTGYYDVKMSPFGRLFAVFLNWADLWFSKIQIQPSTAIGETEPPKNLVPGRANLFGRLNAQSNPWTLESERTIRGFTNSQIQIPATVLTKRDTANTVTAFASATATPSVSPIPTPTPATTITSDNYFGLQVYPSTFLTKNCAQLKTCKVNSIHIQFNEVITTSAGQTIRLLWTYEFSTAVPGLFTMMDRCWSQLITQNGVQTPLTHCDNDLDDFRWGSPP